VAGYGRRHYSPGGVKGNSPHSVFVSRPRERRTAVLVGDCVRPPACIYCLQLPWISQGVAPHILRRGPARRKAVEGRMRVMGFFARATTHGVLPRVHCNDFFIPDATVCQSFSCGARGSSVRRGEASRTSKDVC